MPGWDGAGTAERSYPMSETRGGGWEQQPHVQGTVTVRAQEGLEELLKVRSGGGEEIPLIQGMEQHPRSLSPLERIIGFWTQA